LAFTGLGNKIIAGYTEVCRCALPKSKS